MSRIPSNAGRSRCEQFLASMCEHPPETLAQIDIQQGEIIVAVIPREELQADVDPVALFEEHLDEYGHLSGRLRYHARLRDANGQLTPRGPTAAWGLQRATTAARSARQAGGGTESAAASLGESAASSMREIAGLVPQLAKDAAQSNAAQSEAAAEAQAIALDHQMDTLTQMMGLQMELVKLQTVAELEERPGFFETPAGQKLAETAAGFAGGMLEPLAALVSGFAGLRQVESAERAMELRERELELRSRELALQERELRVLQARQAAAQAPPVDPESPPQDPTPSK